MIVPAWILPASPRSSRTSPSPSPSSPKKKVAPRPGKKSATPEPVVLTRKEVRALWREYHLDPDLSDADRAEAKTWIAALADRLASPLPRVVA